MTSANGDTELAALVEQASQRPNDALVQLKTACACDRDGREAAAVSYYQKAIQLGLSNPVDRAMAYLGLGSTFRVLGRYDEAVEVLEQGKKSFPEHRAMRVFLAMAYYNVGKHEPAMRLLLDVIVLPRSDETLVAYRKAIEFYTDKLDQIWLG